MTRFQWSINYVKRDEYRISDLEFGSFACYDNRPQATDPVLSKRDDTSVWKIRPVLGSNHYYTWVYFKLFSAILTLRSISPLENPEIFWMSPSNVEGTPVVRVWDTMGDEMVVLTGHTRPITSVTFSKDDSQIISGLQDGIVRV